MVIITNFKSSVVMIVVMLSLGTKEGGDVIKKFLCGLLLNSIYVSNHGKGKEVESCQDNAIVRMPAFISGNKTTGPLMTDLQWSTCNDK